MEVEELLKSQDVSYREKGNDLLVCCLNPEHDDKNPSMRIDRVTGVFNCFSCSFKGNIFNYYGVKANYTDQRRQKLLRTISKVRSQTIGLKPLPNSSPYTGTWRNISSETYKKFGAFTTPESDFVDRLVFPISRASGQVVVYVGRHMTGGKPKYYIYPEKVPLPLFPTVVPIQGSVILVEGIFDMLNLHDKGLSNSISCFGVNNLQEDKLTLLKMQGISNIDIAFDPDKPGQEGAAKAKLMAENMGFTARNVVLPENEDPGSLSTNLVQKLKRSLYG